MGIRMKVIVFGILFTSHLSGLCLFPPLESKEGCLSDYG